MKQTQANELSKVKHLVDMDELDHLACFHALRPTVDNTHKYIYYYLQNSIQLQIRQF